MQSAGGDRREMCAGGLHSHKQFSLAPVNYDAGDCNCYSAGRKRQKAKGELVIVVERALPRELTRCLVPSPERPQLPPPSRTWPHLASSTASSTTSTVDCLTTLLRVLLTHFPIMPKFHCRFGDEEGRPVGISKSPLSVQAPTRTAPHS